MPVQDIRQKPEKVEGRRFFFFQAEDGIRDLTVTGVQTCALPIFGRYLAVTVLFALGLMSKPMLVTLPFVLLLLDYWPLGRFDKAASAVARGRREIGRASCRERV